MQQRIYYAVTSILLGIFFYSSTATAQSVKFSNGFPVTKKSEIFSMAELKTGMTGVGYTVFQGDKAEEFRFEVLGLMKGMLGADKDVILAKLSGKKIEFTGVISGMSGSPVYIDGRLLGAVSYRFGRFSKEPIAGITPIEDMLEIYTNSVSLSGKKTKRKRARRVSKEPSKKVDIQELRNRTSKRSALHFPNPRMMTDSKLRPIETPVVVGGAHPALQNFLQKELSKVGMEVQFGAVSNSQTSQQSPRHTGKLDENVPSEAAGVKAAPIAPASPISVVLMRGDMTMSAVGTTTYVENGRVLGFGHPFFGEGHTTFPMATSAILNTLASASGSYKQAAPALEVGTITHDRMTAIAGNFTDVAPMLPVSVRVHRHDKDKNMVSSKFDVEVTRHPQWTPMLAMVAARSAVTNRLGHEPGGTIDMTVKIQTRDRTLSVQDTYAAEAPEQLGDFVSVDIGTLVRLIVTNDFDPADIDAIEVEAHVRPEVEVSYIESVTPEKAWARPGEKISFVVYLKDYLGEMRTQNIEVTIPKTAEKSVTVFVGGSVELDRRDANAVGGFQPRSLDELLGVLADRRPGRGLYARAYVKKPGLRNRVEVYSDLPLSQRTLLQSRTTATTAKVTEVLGTPSRKTFDNVVVGSFSVNLRIAQ
ncbi:MAG: SpoIVB peptidase S55 domain-containing protein [Myxococcota bacterium]|nr:SpoIVB peptidase S55 domain-containing protein [Myxococcota bacterium]